MDSQKDQDAKTSANEVSAVHEQKALEQCSDLEDSIVSNRKETVSVSTHEKGVLVEQMSLGRGSPTQFELEVILFLNSNENKKFYLHSHFTLSKLFFTDRKLKTWNLWIQHRYIHKRCKK